MSISRSKAAILSAETVAVINRGFYQLAGGERVNVNQQVEAAQKGTVAYKPGVLPQVVVQKRHETIVEVRNETTLAGGERLLYGGYYPAALNFASAKNPGGGFLNGARAQEESLCRSSGLFACLNGHDYYQHHRELGGGFYTDYAIYSPDVPVWRGDDEGWLLETWPLSFITMAAPNYRAHGFDPSTKPKLLAGFDERIRKVLLIALAHSHDSIVLGAWGCGAFGNEPQDVAPIFANHLNGEFSGAFKKVVFSILDRSKEHQFITPFEEIFQPNTGKKNAFSSITRYKKPI